MNNFVAHILVVDDDDGIRSLVKQYLIENNFLVTTADSAENAEEKILVIKFDLIILDVMMSGKSGLEFIKNNKSKIDTPIILFWSFFIVLFKIFFILNISSFGSKGFGK